jgi:N-methylhydantoinase A
MGGTSFDVTLIHGGEPSISSERDIDYSVPVRIPMIDIHTIGAGGGSIASVNRAGMLQVGPHSAGSTPGPICYGRGGDLPTVTDANLLLGRVDPSSIPGVGTSVDLGRVEQIVLREIAEPLGLDVAAAAEAIIRVANFNMAAATRLVSLERGHDPRDFAYLAFGGAGPMHAVDLAVELGIPQVIIPRYPGITSALGCIVADIRHDFVKYLDRRLYDLSAEEIEAIFAEHAGEGHRLIEWERVPVEEVRVTHELDMTYEGQTHPFRIPVRGRSFDCDAIREDLHRYFVARFDISNDEVMPVVSNVRTSVVGRRPAIDLKLLFPKVSAPQRADARFRKVHLAGRWHDTAVLRRDSMHVGDVVSGPVIVEQSDSTTVVPPGVEGSVDGYGNIVLYVEHIANLG